MSADVPVTDGPAEPVTVVLIPKARAAVTATAGRLGLSETDVINRAVQAYDYFEEQAAAGATILIWPQHGDIREVRFL